MVMLPRLSHLVYVAACVALLSSCSAQSEEGPRPVRSKSSLQLGVCDPAVIAKVRNWCGERLASLKSDGFIQALQNSSENASALNVANLKSRVFGDYFAMTPAHFGNGVSDVRLKVFLLPPFEGEETLSKMRVSFEAGAAASGNSTTAASSTSELASIELVFSEQNSCMPARCVDRRLGLHRKPQDYGHQPL